MAGWDSFSVQNGPGDWCPPPYNPPNLQLEIFSTKNYMLLIGDQLFVTVEIILVWICQTETDWQVRVKPVRSQNIYLGNSKYWSALESSYKIWLQENVRKNIYYSKVESIFLQNQIILR